MLKLLAPSIKYWRWQRRWKWRWWCVCVCVCVHAFDASNKYTRIWSNDAKMVARFFPLFSSISSSSFCLFEKMRVAWLLYYSIINLFLSLYSELQTHDSEWKGYDGDILIKVQLVTSISFGLVLNDWFWRIWFSRALPLSLLSHSFCAEAHTHIDSPSYSVRMSRAPRSFVFFIYNFNESNELSKFSMQVIGNESRQ